MTRPSLTSWPLFLLLVIGRHGLVAGAAKSATHSEAHSVVQGSEYTKLLVHPYLEEWHLGKMAPAREDTVRVDPDALNPNLSLEGLDDDAASGRADFPCPSAAAIAPCVCTVYGSVIDLECTEVESEEQLANVFLQEFPVKELRGFVMTSNGAVEVLGNILNGVTFETIDLSPGPFALQAISEYFLLDSRHTLGYLRIASSNLLSRAFPFATLIAMEALETLVIDGSNLTWIPKINSPMIGSLEFRRGRTDVLEPGSEGFGYLGIHLEYNRLQSLRSATFPLRNGPTLLHLYSNQISTIEPGTFVLPEATDSFSLDLDLGSNDLTTFDEAVFGDLMPFIYNLELQANPLTCGCDIAWVVTNSAYMYIIDSDTACADGTLLTDLDPQYFLDFC